MHRFRPLDGGSCTTFGRRFASPERPRGWRAGPLGIKDRERERMGLGYSERTFEFCYNVKFRITQGNFTRSLFLQHKVASFGTGVGS